jgi:hypothetical protein
MEENERRRKRLALIAEARRRRSEEQQARQSAWNPENSLAPLELGASMIQNAAIEPVAGLAGVAAAAIPGGMTGPEAIEKTRELRYEPQLESTQKAQAKIAQGMDKALGWWFDWTDKDAERIALSGAPGLAAGYKAVMDTAPFFLTRGGRVSSFFRRTKGYNPAQMAQDMGYVLPPTTRVNGVTVGGPFKQFAQTLGGKGRTTARINLKNQRITNEFARRELGLKPGEPFSGQAFARISKPWKVAQNKIKGLDMQLRVDGKYVNQIKKIYEELQNHFTGKPLPKSVQKEFQYLMSPEGSLTPKALLDQVYKLRDEARRNFAGRSMKQQQKGYAQWNAATALEDMLERQLRQASITKGSAARRYNRNLVEDFRKSRVELAKIRTIENALDGGDVNLARLLAHRNRGGYLSGNLEVMADMFEQFPRALRTSSTLGEAAGLGELDLLLMGAGVSSAITGAGVTGGWMAGWAPLRSAAARYAAKTPPQYGTLQEWLLRGELLSSQVSAQEETD